MVRNKVENNIVVNFAHQLLGEYRPIPMTLLRCYAQLQLNETELIRLLRVIAPILNGGAVTAAQIAAEFGVDEQDAPAILQPYLDKGLLEQADGGGYTCYGLMSTLYMLWARGRREEPGKGASAPLLSATDEQESIRQISHLYRRFEREFGRVLAPSESSRLRKWLDDEHIAAELIEEALTRSVLQGKRTMSYVGSILNKWLQQGFTTVAQVLELDVKPEPAEKAAPAKRSRKPAADSGKFADVYLESIKDEAP